jgi:hypothetical protein
MTLVLANCFNPRQGERVAGKVHMYVAGLEDPTLGAVISNVSKLVHFSPFDYRSLISVTNLEQ